MAKEDLPESQSDLLPAILEEAEVTLTLPDDIQIDDTFKQVKSRDLQITNDMLRVAYAGFSKASTISSLTKLGEFTLKTIESRRKVLCMQYGASTSGKSQEEYEFLE